MVFSPLTGEGVYVKITTMKHEHTEHKHATGQKKAELVHRLKIVRGHIDKVIDMVEKDEYCMNVIHQSNAVQKALEKFDREMLENHLRTCVRDAFKSGQSEEKIEEILEAFDKDKK